MAQEPHVPTLETRAQVHAMASFGINQDNMSKYLGITRATLSKYYEEELAKAMVDKVVTVANALYRNAVENNNVSAQIFFLKTRAGWREVDKTEVEIDSNDVVEKIKIEVIGKTKEG